MAACNSDNMCAYCVPQFMTHAFHDMAGDVASKPWHSTSTPRNPDNMRAYIAPQFMRAYIAPRFMTHAVHDIAGDVASTP